MRLKLLICVIGVGGALAQPAAVRVTPVALPHQPLGLVQLPNGKALNLIVAPAAGAHHSAGDDPRRIWTVSDRGPSHDCPSDRDRTLCPAGKRGRVLLLPGYSPSIYAIDVGETSARFSDMVTLKGVSGRPVSGIPGPRPDGQVEEAFSADGRAIDPDPSGVDPGGIVRLSDGTFFLAEGYGPSLLEVSGDGVIRRRIVPKSLTAEFAAADYPVEPSLPAFLAQRTFGRGFDGLAISNDEAHLYTALQGPLAREGQQASAPSLVRILKIDRRSGQVLAQYGYRLDLGTPESAPHETRLAEIAAVGARHLLILERNRDASRIYSIDIAAGTPLPGAAAEGDAAYEQIAEADWPARNIRPLDKRLLFSSEAAVELTGRLYGMAVLSERELAITTSREYGIEGGRTQMFRLTFPGPITN